MTLKYQISNSPSSPSSRSLPTAAGASSPSSLRRSVASSLSPSPFIIRKAFSLVEIMFAVVILGIGFIMIAGMFPVAIEQSRATVAETTGTIVAEGGVRTLKACPAGWLLPTLNPDPDWKAIPGVGTQAISSADPRFAFIGFARRPFPNQYEVITFAVVAQNTSTWPGPPSLSAAAANGDLNAANHSNAKFNLQVHTGEPTLITIVDLPTRAHAVEGAMVLISDTSYPALRGTVLTLGAIQAPGGNTWQVLPVTTPPPSWVEGANFLAVKGFIIGAGLIDPSDKNSGRTGPSIAVHASSIATFIKP